MLKAYELGHQEQEQQWKDRVLDKHKIIYYLEV